MRKVSRIGPALTTVAAVTFVLFAGRQPEALAAAPAEASQPQSMRLSPSQFRQSIEDIFGTSIAIKGRFEPETRVDGLLAIGGRAANITDTGLQRYHALARGIAEQVVSSRLVPCKPRSIEQRDDACAQKFLSQVGRLLYRRALTDQEVQAEVAAAGSATEVQKDFYAGLSITLERMLISPSFLFRWKTTEPDPSRPGYERLDSYSKAAVLSFFLWNTTPDEELLAAAERGELHTREGMERQVNRLISSPRLDSGVRAFFADMLGFSDFETLSKNPTIFPEFTLSVKNQAQEQTLRTIVDHLLVKQGDYRDLFTTPHTFLTRSLAALYGVPLVEETDNGQPQRWIPYSYQPGDPRAGILSHVSFVALHSPAGRSSPTLRGKALRELFMCQKVPPPPANVDFSVVQDTGGEVHKTARERLIAHSSEPQCAGCHKITDPIGLALENFDGVGRFRTMENGAPIDTSGELNGVKYDSPAGLAVTVRDNRTMTDCVARKAFAFGSGRMPAPRDPQWQQVQQAFAESNYNLTTLIRQIALSDLFFQVPSNQIVSAAAAGH